MASRCFAGSDWTACRRVPTSPGGSDVEFVRKAGKGYIQVFHLNLMCRESRVPASAIGQTMTDDRHPARAETDGWDRS